MPKSEANIDNSSNNDMQRSLGRIEGKLDALMLSFLNHSKDDKEEFTAVNLRMAIVEKKLYVIGGALSLIVFLSPFLPNILKHLGG